MVNFQKMKKSLKPVSTEQKCPDTVDFKTLTAIKNHIPHKGELNFNNNGN